MPGGGQPAGAEAAALWLAAQGVEALLSFGLAGGLNPGLAPGAIVVPAWVRTGADLYRTDLDLARRFGPPGGVLLAGEAIAATAADKAHLFARTGAVAIDLESGAVARVAARHGLPFAVLRAICDPAGRDLPPAALLALDAGGGIPGLRVLASVLRHPRQLPALLGLARDAAAARDGLRRAVASVRPGGRAA